MFAGGIHHPVGGVNQSQQGALKVILMQMSFVT